MAVPLYIFPTIPCYKVILTEYCITILEKSHSFSLEIQNIIKYMWFFFFASSILLAPPKSPTMKEMSVFVNKYSKYKKKIYHFPLYFPS